MKCPCGLPASASQMTIPFHIQRSLSGLTSPSIAGLKDLLLNYRLSWPSLEVSIFPSKKGRRVSFPFSSRWLLQIRVPRFYFGPFSWRRGIPIFCLLSGSYRSLPGRRSIRRLGVLHLPLGPSTSRCISGHSFVQLQALPGGQIPQVASPSFRTCLGCIPTIHTSLQS